MKHYLENIDEVCRDVKTGVDGITSQEAESRLESNGKTNLPRVKRADYSAFVEAVYRADDADTHRCRDNFGYSDCGQQFFRRQKEFPSDVIIIMAVVIINAVLGVVQESKAEKAIDALQK